MKKKLPVFKSDKEAEEFLDKDLADYLHSENFAQFVFEYQPKQKSVNLRISERNHLRLQRKPATQNDQHNE